MSHNDALTVFYELELALSTGEPVGLLLADLEAALLVLPKGAEPANSGRACEGCLFLCLQDDTCANADVDNIDRPKQQPPECGLRVSCFAAPGARR